MLLLKKYFEENFIFKVKYLHPPHRNSNQFVGEEIEIAGSINCGNEKSIKRKLRVKILRGENAGKILYVVPQALDMLCECDRSPKELSYLLCFILSYLENPAQKKGGKFLEKLTPQWFQSFL